MVRINDPFYLIYRQYPFRRTILVHPPTTAVLHDSKVAEVTTLSAHHHLRPGHHYPSHFRLGEDP